MKILFGSYFNNQSPYHRLLGFKWRIRNNYSEEVKNKIYELEENAFIESAFWFINRGHFIK